VWYSVKKEKPNKKTKNNTTKKTTGKQLPWALFVMLWAVHPRIRHFSPGDAWPTRYQPAHEL